LRKAVRVTATGTLVLEPSPTAPRDARRWLLGRLDELGCPELGDVALLLLSEAVTNAVLHARSDVEVRVAVWGTGVRVEVQDGSGRPPALRRPSTAATTGRGTTLMQALADDWGWRAVPEGKVVWFDVLAEREAWPLDGAPAAG
jgi:anti-sigma regulatory factor (Ser/Thr protein kinase)